MIWTKPGQLATLLLLVLWGAPLHGQEDDSLKIKKDKAQKKFRLTVLPAGGYDPETGVLTWKTRTPDLFEDGPVQSAEYKCVLETYEMLDNATLTCPHCRVPC